MSLDPGSSEPCFNLPWPAGRPPTQEALLVDGRVREHERDVAFDHKTVVGAVEGELAGLKPAGHL